MSCADCFVGTVHEGTPGGYIVELHGLATYVAEPPDKSSIRGIIVIIPDAWGWALPNTRVLADEMARSGNFYVYLPDFMKAGYCWGGKHATILASGETQPNGWPLVDSIFVGHPGGLKIPQDIEKIRIPYSVAVGDRDFVLKQNDVRKMMETLNKRKDIPTEVKIYPGARHGFALRGDPGDKQGKLQGEAAMRQAVKWLLDSLCRAEELARVGRACREFQV
ncbi:MAG: hypothetical protein Q9167_006721 [Letrouitia subvulpina]